MKFLNKIGFYINYIFEHAFIILMVMIIFATSVIDKKIDTPYANTVPYSNVIYYLFAICILLLSYIGFRIHKEDMSLRSYVLLSVFVVFAVGGGGKYLLENGFTIL